MQVHREGEKSRAMGRKRKLGTSGWEEPRLTITDLIRNYNCLDTAAKSTGGKARLQSGSLSLSMSEDVMVGAEKPVEVMLLGVEKPGDRKKRKLETERNLLEGFEQKHKRCRTPLTDSETERDKTILNYCNFKTLLTSKEPAAGAARRGGQGSPCQGVGEVLGQDSGCSPETPARF